MHICASVSCTSFYLFTSGNSAGSVIFLFRSFVWCCWAEISLRSKNLFGFRGIFSVPTSLAKMLSKLPHRPCSWLTYFHQKWRLLAHFVFLGLKMLWRGLPDDFVDLSFRFLANIPLKSGSTRVTLVVRLSWAYGVRRPTDQYRILNQTEYQIVIFNFNFS